jgi:DNA-binding CsgD family transcriptional regulator
VGGVAGAVGGLPAASGGAQESLRDLLLHPDVLVGAAERHLARAALLLGAAAALLESSASGLGPAERSRLSTTLSVLGVGLEGPLWAPFWAEGRVQALSLMAPAAPGAVPVAAPPPPEAHPAGRASPVTLPSEALRRTLTSREREVLRLVAEGLSNEQIAVRLITEKRTVESHLAHIGSKLRLPRRAVIAHARDILSALAPSPSGSA